MRMDVLECVDREFQTLSWHEAMPAHARGLDRSARLVEAMPEACWRSRPSSPNARVQIERDETQTWREGHSMPARGISA
jgi:hypothetical protein